MSSGAIDTDKTGKKDSHSKRLSLTQHGHTGDGDQGGHLGDRGDDGDDGHDGQEHDAEQAPDERGHQEAPVFLQQQ